MYRYGEYCPLARTTSILGDYWTPLIVREMLHGRSHFNELVRSLPEISRSLLASRLRSLERAGVVERRAGDGRGSSSYVLTAAGLDLRRVLEVMSDWGERWSDVHTHEADIDPMATVCMLRARCDGRALPERRVVVEIVTRPPQRSLSWLVLENGFASLCVSHPGFDVDLYVTTEASTLYGIWRGHLTVAGAVAQGLIELQGDPELGRRFAGWFGQVRDEFSEHLEALSSSVEAEPAARRTR